jgi:hypothetical protein
LRHPAALVAALAAAACVLVTVTFQVYETDFWQHLLVGKAIWTLKRVPTTQLWTWPTYGARDVNSSWGFEALCWPFWATGGVAGIFVWRWLSTLAAFGLSWATARRMGARGLAPLVAFVLCALTYRQRSQLRPETLVAVLIALEVWILEARRQGGPDRSLWIVAIAWVWANVHISYPLSFVLLGAHALGERVHAGRIPAPAAPAAAPGRRRPAPLWWVVLGAAAVSFLNPYGWRPLWQPFEYFLFWRNEPLFKLIGELTPVDWSLNLRNGLPLLLAAWPALLLWRVRRRGWDVVEATLCLLFTVLGLRTQRFLGFYAVVAAPHLARDLGEWVGARTWPRWTAAPAARAVITAGLCLAICLPEWRAPDPTPGVGIQMRNYPEGACDFMAAQGVRGRGFNQFRSGGYLLWRFWPEQDRLPFMDIHQAGTPDIRRMYVAAMFGRDGWLALEQRFGFEWALLSRPQNPGEHYLDYLDADSSWALVFVDDAGAVYVKRRGALAGVADRFGYGAIGAGRIKVNRVAEACGRDPVLRARVRQELERSIAASPRTALAHSLLANLALFEGRFPEARAELERALAEDPATPRAYERMGVVELAAGNPYAALQALKRERSRGTDDAGLHARMGMAYQQLGQIVEARAAYRRALRRDPNNPAARQMLHALEAAEAH